MTSFELGNLIKDRLGAIGLSQYLDDAHEQYLEFPEGFFAEVVLKDGSKLSEAQRLVGSIEEELRKQGVELNALVRATWEVVAVENAGVVLPGSAGVQRFIVTLRSGERECKISVDVTAGALVMVLAAFNQGALRAYGTVRNDVLISIVAEFVRQELDYGGESYWDPLLRPQLTLNEDALEYITGHHSVKAG